MKHCPCCGEELKKGHIYSGRRVRWTEADRDFAGLLNEADGEFNLRTTVTGWQGAWEGFPHPGYYCPACELILLPQKEDETL